MGFKENLKLLERELKSQQSFVRKMQRQADMSAQEEANQNRKLGSRQTDGCSPAKRAILPLTRDTVKPTEKLRKELIYQTETVLKREWQSSKQKPQKVKAAVAGLRLLRQNQLAQLEPQKHLKVLTDGN